MSMEKENLEKETVEWDVKFDGPSARFVAFLYILMREAVPFGMVAKIVEEVNKSESFLFTNEHAAEMACDFFQRLGGEVITAPDETD